jgi:hypothetical protein
MVLMARRYGRIGAKAKQDAVGVLDRDRPRTMTRTDEESRSSESDTIN